MKNPDEAGTDDVAREHDRQTSAREDLRDKVDQKVGKSIERETDLTAPEERAQVKSMATELKAKSVNEIRRSERELDSGRRLKRIYQFVSYAFFLIYGLIGLMIALELVGARDSSGFMQFMRAVTTPLLAPFRSVVADPSVGSSQLMLSFVLALIVYALIHLAIKGIFRIMIRRDGSDL
ncbi:MAG: YggT family protein [Thermoanaerobaculia bacterium]